jgi:hypothetical protein
MNNKFSSMAVLAFACLALEPTLAANQPRESIGKLAHGIAEARVQGRSEGEALRILTSGRKGMPGGDLYIALQQVVAWVYTVQLPPPDARKLVYTKCLNHEFFAYNPKLDG